MKWTNRVSWRDLSQWLHEISPLYNEPIYSALLPPDSAFDPQGFEIQFALSEGPFRQEIEQAIILLWPNPDDAFEHLSPQATEFLRIRIDAARTLASALASAPTPWFPFPSQSMEAVLHWLLVDYWGSEGRVLAALHYFVYWTQNE